MGPITSNDQEWLGGIRQKFEAVFSRTDEIFESIPPHLLTARPIPHRHPFIFYWAHIYAFYDAKLRIGDDEFRGLFDRGIDPDLDVGAVLHSHSCCIDNEDWPPAHQIRRYAARIRGSVLKDTVRFDTDCLLMCLEHELMHQETTMHLIQALHPPDCLRPTKTIRNWLSLAAADAPSPTFQLRDFAWNPFVKIPGGWAELGYDRRAATVAAAARKEPDEGEAGPTFSFAWDNELPPTRLFVQSFHLQQYPVCNAEFFKFFLDGGYQSPEYWLPEDFAFVQRLGIRMPETWSLAEASDPTSIRIRTCWQILGLEEAALLPVMASLAEAEAYARWAGARVLSEAEWHRAVEYNETSCSLSGRTVGFECWDLQPSSRVCRKDLVADLVGVAWEWTCTAFGPLTPLHCVVEADSGNQPASPGFVSSPHYPGYSQDFFDSKHYVLKGGSWATDVQLACRRSFRNWYQRRYRFALAKFRLARDEFDQDVLTGVMDAGASSKSLSSKYLYDDAGSGLFSEITSLPEYYPTRTELSILQNSAGSIVSYLDGERKVRVVELGAGDGQKTAVLLERLLQERGTAGLVFCPIDISREALLQISSALRPLADAGMQMAPMEGDNLASLRAVASVSSSPGTSSEKDGDALPLPQNLVLFLGSSLGNFQADEAVAFLREVAASLCDGDLLLLGVDLKKDISVMEAAYDDAAGVTAQFSLNLLERMNRQLGMNFDPSQWKFRSFYDPREGAVVSGLLSLRPQSVASAKLRRVVHFQELEYIQTERSAKFSLDAVHALAETAGFEVLHDVMDDCGWFLDSLWTVRRPS